MNDQVRASRAPIPWLRIAAEAVAIVGSILLAFGIDAAWDARQDRSTERQIIADLRADFDSTMVSLEGALARTIQARDASLALLDHTGPAPRLASAERFDSLLPLVSSEGTFDPTNGTLASLLSSEGLQVISNYEVRALLSKWSQELDNTRRIEDAKHDDYRESLNVYLAQHVPLRATLLGGSAFTVDREALLGDMRFENVLTSRLIWTSLSAAAFQSLRSVGERIQAALRAYEP